MKKSLTEERDKEINHIVSKLSEEHQLNKKYLQKEFEDKEYQLKQDINYELKYHKRKENEWMEMYNEERKQRGMLDELSLLINNKMNKLIGETGEKNSEISKLN
jgi:hypothetical protein